MGDSVLFLNSNRLLRKPARCARSPSPLWSSQNQPSIFSNHFRNFPNFPDLNNSRKAACIFYRQVLIPRILQLFHNPYLLKFYLIYLWLKHNIYFPQLLAFRFFRSRQIRLWRKLLTCNKQFCCLLPTPHSQSTSTELSSKPVNTFRVCPPAQISRPPTNLWSFCTPPPLPIEKASFRTAGKCALSGSLHRQVPYPTTA